MTHKYNIAAIAIRIKIDHFAQKLLKLRYATSHRQGN